MLIEEAGANASLRAAQLLGIDADNERRTGTVSSSSMAAKARRRSALRNTFHAKPVDRVRLMPGENAIRVS
ncbi:MAG: hypothetical protein WD271_08105 [Acidimicrobiia bacterium]